MRTNGRARRSASRTRRTIPAYALSDAGRVARRSKASPALAVPLETGAPRGGDRQRLAGERRLVDTARSLSRPRRPAAPRRPAPGRGRRRDRLDGHLLELRHAPVRDARRALEERGQLPPRTAPGGSSSAFPPVSIRAITAPVRYSPSASAPAIASSAIASTPTSPRARLRGDRPAQRDQRQRGRRGPDHVPPPAGDEEVDHAAEHESKEDQPDDDVRLGDPKRGRPGAQGTESSANERSAPGGCAQSEIRRMARCTASRRAFSRGSSNMWKSMLFIT